MKPSRLGRGLEAILGHTKEEQPQGMQVLDLAVSQIHPNPNQPRQDFDPAALAELVESVHRNGILQPVIVRPDADGYQLIAGERRWRAAMQAGLPTVPAIVRTATDTETLELALIENLQREDLNPIEQARAYKELIERFGLTQEEASGRIGKNRSSIANMLRLLDLPQDIQDAVSRGTLSMGHARALLGLPDRNEQRRLATRIQEEDLSVRQTERLVADRLRRSRATPAPEGPRPAHLTDLERQLREALGTRVTITQHRNSTSGRISIDFFSQDDFQRVLARIVGQQTPPQPS